jgi:hypothetical protein
MRGQLVSGQRRVFYTSSPAPVSLPARVVLTFDHPGPHRIECDIAIAITGEQVILFLYQACFVASLRQRAAAIITMVDVQYVMPAEVARLILFRYGTVPTRYT